MDNEKITMTKDELGDFMAEILQELKQKELRITKEDIIKTKNREERQKLIADNLDLFE